MMLDVRDTLCFQFNKKTLKAVFPRIFDSMAGQDVNFEIVSSNSRQDLVLQYCHNIVAMSHAVIFVNTGIDAPPTEW